MAGLRALGQFVDDGIFSHGRNPVPLPAAGGRSPALFAGFEGHFLIAGRDDVLAIDGDPGHA